MTMAIGDKAPDFDLPCDDGGRARLADLAGRKAVLFFYPRDDTSGCTLEARDFTALAGDFAAAGVEVIGISKDPVRSHEKFRAKHGLLVRLASDEGLDTCERYGTWVGKSLYGRKHAGIERTTVLIGADGRVAGLWPKVSVPGHAALVLEAARRV